ncbi:response regulator [Pseudohongiella sp.]|uniref:Uncharacterized protein n=1 Tax=marine sediment metagenome TaxID=412755 RepID=A0A0F9YFB8_9ZZZZ|nr:response regulator transcription factor [Pseudohongiella sp.]HDZ08357.1 response regulator transcription factor [Pseudohongiella sp.]HEA61922.1 response regulator transcription factor [Pseudohongiella sp.]
MIQVLLADDHAIVRQGLSRVLALTPDMKVAGEVSDGWLLLDYLANKHIDLLLLDMSMPGPSGIDLISSVSERWPDLPLVVFSMYSDSHLATKAIKAGAKGYLTKDSDPDMIISAIRHCLAGKHYLHPALGARLMLEEPQAPGQELHRRLSAREHQIFLLLVNGLPLSTIGDNLHISPKTVSTHKFRIMQKLSMTSISELVRYAVKFDLIDG